MTSEAPAQLVPVDPPPADGVLRHLGFGGCVRLPLRVDARRLAGELALLPQEAWLQPERDPVVHFHVDSFFAIGYPRDGTPRPPEDRAVLAALPYLREVLRTLVPSTPTRAIVQRLRPGGLLPIHTDTPRYFRGTVRLSMLVAGDGAPRFFCNGAWYAMAPGDVLAIDNLRPHGVLNDGASARINVVADYLPSAGLVALLRAGEAASGIRDDAARAAIESASRAHYRRNRWRSLRYELKKRWRRRGERAQPAT
ncbi:MAG: aspartyl/asparaginyl beta-hydroxylase domain-containing protein [Thermodesulfobacteriota bacterium]